MTNLPDEIIVEILLRLPVKSLCRFRCVSKPWRILISDHEFIKKHLDLVKKQEPLHAMRIMIRYTFYDIKSWSLHNLVNDPSGSAVELYHPHKNLRHFIRFIGSCNGLVCYCLEKVVVVHLINMFIWNPTTGESKSLPLPSSMNNIFPSGKIYGFGYDCSTDDYKVFMNYVADDEVRCFKKVVGVYSLKTNSWGLIEHLDYDIDGLGKFVNGALHWLGTRSGQTHRENQMVISLDLADLVFHELPQPDNYGYGKTSIHVQVMGESLSIFCDKLGHSVDVWVMKEYGVKESWTKLVSLPYTLEMTNYKCEGSCCTSKYIMLYCSGKLVFYELDKKTFTFPTIDGQYIPGKLEILMETLVSPNAYGGQGVDIIDSELKEKEAYYVARKLGF